MRKRIIKMFVLSCLALSLLLKPVFVSATELEATPRAGCSDWVIASVSLPSCQYDGSCPYTQYTKPEMHYQNIYYQRTCVSSTGTITTDNKMTIKKIGCC